MHIIKTYFPELSEEKFTLLEKLEGLYNEWNQKINVISRKDMQNFVEHHVLHSLAIAKIINFTPGTAIIDVGTGGGFPGIPLAILFPETSFHLVDSIGKKITVVNEVVNALNLTNVTGEQIRIENVKDKYDFVISRAVTRFDAFRKMVRKNIHAEQKNNLKNGIIYLKGGEFSEELRGVQNKITLYEISDFFKEPFFETKKIIHLPIH
ncbi:MAG: 16S rRNA (guanine(527)-N(7))-methyltransferase RsmG [Salinivirgaceae bacterium]|nr:16S rRNA (guanine(527)-N(7))-methyltransferase RsmG [Salinivirgaceae bacterium]